MTSSLRWGMEQRLFARASFSTGIVGLGTWRTFDVSPGDVGAMDNRRRVVDSSIAAGVNFFDSSPMYGRAEAVLGRTLEGRRDDVLVATKVWTSSDSEARQQIEDALRFYGGRVDLYQVHNLVAWEKRLEELRSLQRDGKVRAIGVTDYRQSSFGTIERIMETQAIDAIQIPYNATSAAPPDRLLDLAATKQVGVIVMSPLGTGELARCAPAPRELEPFRAFGIRTWAQALVKWVVSDTRVTVTIPATSRPERAIENAAAGDPPFFGEAERERVSWLARNAAR